MQCVIYLCEENCAVVCSTYHDCLKGVNPMEIKRRTLFLPLGEEWVFECD
jgi:hypothetical protein